MNNSDRYFVSALAWGVVAVLHDAEISRWVFLALCITGLALAHVSRPKEN